MSKNSIIRRTEKTGVVLLSGGLDSAVTLYFAKSKGFTCNCLIFDYGQRHRREVDSAKKIAKAAFCSYRVLKINFPWKGSSLLDKTIRVRTSPSRKGLKVAKIPSTYVPARNIIFLSFAVSYAEAIKAKVIFIGAHSQDYPGYPDCRAGFFKAFKKVIDTGTKSGIEKQGLKLSTPLINKKKSQIIKLGSSLGVPFGLTWSCYEGKNKPCGKCDSCFYRARGFAEAGISDNAI